MYKSVHPTSARSVTSKDDWQNQSRHRRYRCQGRATSASNRTLVDYTTDVVPKEIYRIDVTIVRDNLNAQVKVTIKPPSPGCLRIGDTRTRIGCIAGKPSAMRSRKSLKASRYVATVASCEASRIIHECGELPCYPGLIYYTVQLQFAILSNFDASKSQQNKASFLDSLRRRPKVGSHCT